MSHASATQGSALLNQLQGRGQLEPGSKLMDIGLDHHNPLQAVRALADSQERMSTALHEITHFDSLENSLGHVLGLLGYMASVFADRIETYLKSGDRIDPGVLEHYLYFREEHHSRLDLWRPLLEGLAVFAQTARPCPQLDTMLPAHSTLLALGTALSSLDPLEVSSEPGGRGLENASGGILSGGYDAMRAGPGLRFGGKALAVALELNQEESWLPYFLGHAYVRALHDRFMRADPELECPELFIRLMLRILYSSTTRLLEPSTAWDTPEAAERVYGWIDLVERSPERVRNLRGIDDTTDVLWYLATGESRAGFERSRLSTAATLGRLVPRAWERFAGMVQHLDFARLNRERAATGLSSIPPPEAAEQVATAILVGTGSLNVSRGGECKIAGLVPRGFGEKHALALRVEERTWWLAVEEEGLRTLVLDPDVIPVLTREALQASGAELEPSDLRLGVSCFVTHVGYGLRAPDFVPKDTRWPHVLIELHRLREANSSLLTVLEAGSGRSHLVPVGAEAVQGLHTASQESRRITADFASVTTNGWLEAFSRSNEERATELTREAISREALRRSMQQEIWAHRVLGALLGTQAPNRTKRRIMAARMGVVLDDPWLDDLLVKSYSAPCRITGEGAADFLAGLEGVNLTCRKRLGKAAFRVNAATSTVQYLGLWAH